MPDPLRGPAKQQLVRERIELALQVALAFIFIDGTMDEVVINVEGTPEVTLDQLPERFLEMRLNEPIRAAVARQPLEPADLA